LSGEALQPYRHQVAEIPPVKVEVTECRLHAITCSICGTVTRAQLPVGVPQGGFGPRFQAMVSILSGRYHLSKRETVGILGDFFAVDLGLGSVSKLEKRTSAAIAQVVEEARSYVRSQAAVHQDETGWREGAKKAWLWVLATQSVTIFLIDLHRSAEVAKKMLGTDFKGILNSDRWSAYNWLANRYRQLCWSHLQRDFQAFVERGGDSQALGEALLTFAHQMFSAWHLVQTGNLSRTQFQDQMQPLRTQVGELFRQAQQKCCDKAQSARILPLLALAEIFSNENRLYGHLSMLQVSNQPTILPNKKSVRAYSGAIAVLAPKVRRAVVMSNVL
jgi:transposase